MFQVKAVVVGFAGDEEKFPCHFGHHVGDELVFDGERFSGRICPHVLSVLLPHLAAMCDAGPRYVQPSYYGAFWYAPPNSVRDSSMKTYDGVGWRPVTELEDGPAAAVRALLPPGSFAYPPSETRTVNRDVVVLCPDIRTAAVFRLEAFDLSEVGEATPYFRKSMVLLDTIRKNGGVPLHELRDRLSPAQREKIYPLAGPALVQALIDQAEALGYVDILDGVAGITPEGEARLSRFVATLSEAERKALEMEGH
jgi:uncharacterized repeat protein (TIGR04076 family)